MKHESQNPVYSRFKHLLTRAGRYPAEHVDIFWNLTDNDAVKDVETVLIPSEALRDDKLKAEYESAAALCRLLERRIRPACRGVAMSDNVALSDMSRNPAADNGKSSKFRA
jgi:hypothetical protein